MITELCYKYFMSRKPKYSCFDYAIFLLGRQPYAFKTMQEKLLNKGYETEDVQATSSRLKDLGYLDDAIYAKNRVRSRAEFSKWGKHRIIQELKNKGIAGEHIDAALEFWEEGADELVEGEVSTNSWQENATDLLQRKYGPWPGELPMEAPCGFSYEERSEHMKRVQKEKSRRINFLIRRGFSIDEAQAAFLDAMA